MGFIQDVICTVHEWIWSSVSDTTEQWTVNVKSIYSCISLHTWPFDVCLLVESTAGYNKEVESGWGWGWRGGPKGTPMQPGSLRCDRGGVKVRIKGAGRRKNEAMQLGQEICGKLPTKAQENWEGWGRSTGTVPGPVRGRPPDSWCNWRKHTDSLSLEIKSLFPCVSPSRHTHTQGCFLYSCFIPANIFMQEWQMIRNKISAKRLNVWFRWEKVELKT